MPVVCHLVPYIAGKAQGKGWLTERGNCLAMELSHLGAAASQYYIFRTYISLPFWDEAGLWSLQFNMHRILTSTHLKCNISDLQPMTLTETTSSITHEDAQNSALVLVSALSILTGVAPASF